MRKLQIAVLGSSKEICTKQQYKIASEAGEEIAKLGALCLTGGGHGVMEAAMKGAKKHNGLTLGIMPWGKMEKYNKYCDLVVATGIGWSRDAINLNSCDGAILVGGGAGSLNEATYAYIENIPIVAITSSGGWAKKVAGVYLDERKTEKILSAKNAKEAMRKLLKVIEKRLCNDHRETIVKRKEKY